MITEYLNEIIALVSLLIVTAIYLMVKSKNRDKEETNEKDFPEIDTQESTTLKSEGIEVEESYDTPNDIEEEIEITEEVIEELAGSEEGDFGPIEESVEEVSLERTFHKRSVPDHGKITKQDFKEFSGNRILVAEDNLINQKVLAGLLADSGIELVIANDGKEALDILAQDDDFLMVLMDAHMPRIDGFEATRSIRANPKYEHIVIVALSGDTASDDIKKMTDAGMTEHLEKPLKMDSLYNIIYAYSGEAKSKKNDNDDEYIDIIMTTELNGDKGLSICGGDENFYMEILNEFVQSYSDSATSLQELLKEEKLQEADKLLLDIIGIAANIGADPLHETANDLKDALKDTTEKSYLTLVEPYQTHLKALLQDIHDYKTL